MIYGTWVLYHDCIFSGEVFYQMRHEFKCVAILALTIFKRSARLHETRSINMSWDSVLHTLEKTGFCKEFTKSITKRQEK